MSAATSSRTRSRMHPAPKFAAASSRDISKYTRVSKPKESRKDLGEKTAGPAAGTKTSIETLIPLSSSRKRKANNEANLAPSVTLNKKLRSDAPADENKSASRTNKETTTSVVKTTQTPIITITERAVSKRKRQPEDDAPRAPSDLSDATQAEALLERLNLQSPVRKRSKASAARATLVDQNILPAELIDLLGLHRAFLKTLSLHYAHNGANVPVDLRAICPDIAQAWAKRKVTVEDVRRCIGIMGWNSATNDTAESCIPLSLSDYGRGKICIELDQSICGSLLNDHELNRMFETKLRAMWSAREDSNIQWFMASLPKAIITSSSSASHISPVLAKGQQRLEEIKEAMVKKQQEKEVKAQGALVSPDASKMSLLERIRHKEAQAAQAPQGPSAAYLQRQAALQRAEDVADVLRMLVLATSNGQPRVSFTMPVLLMKLKDSLRVPVSSEEGTACVRLLAAEVAPRWLRVVTIGGKDNVVVQTAFQPTKVAIQERVQELTAR